MSFESCFKPDDEVRFIAGPFFGLIGRLAKVDRRGRVEILLNILSGKIKVKTHARNLQPAQAAGNSLPDPGNHGFSRIERGYP